MERRCFFALTLTFAFMAWSGPLCFAAAPLVPGTGVKLKEVGDDFEQPDWQFTPNNPKSSDNIDKTVREPLGESSNGRIYESSFRGHPDLVKRVTTPPGGISGSQGALLLRSVHTGIPGRISKEQQQDDLMVAVDDILGYALSPDYSPSVVVRVFLPPWEKWEQRSGSSFGFRMDCLAHGKKPVDGLIRQWMVSGWHNYWPGMFIELHRQEDGYQSTHAQLLLRADPRGHDFPGPIIHKPGWWTLGMSITTDGQVHYYASEGVDDLTEKDFIASQFPYSFKCHQFNRAFFNIVNIDDGQTWSTPWVVDDPSIYYIPKGWTLERVARYNAALRRQLAKRQAAPTPAKVAATETSTAASTPIRPLRDKPLTIRR